jgi:hypothetical protein
MRAPSHNHTDYRHPDKTKSSSARTREARRGRAARAAALLALFFAIVTVFHSSASYAWPAGSGAATDAAAVPSAAPAVERDFASGFFFPALFQLPGVESVQTYADDCTTPKDAFTLGDTVCVKASVPFVLLNRWRINIIGPANVVRGSLAVSGLTQTFSFTLPSTPQTVIDDDTFDNRGTWRADLTTVGGSRRASTAFDVSSATATDAAADLQIISAIDDADGVIPSGGSLLVTVYVLNMGPNAATNVVVAPPTGAGIALQSFAPVNGSDCGGTCSVASLASRGVAKFTATYNVTGAAGSKVVARSSVTSDTFDPRPTFDYRVDVDNPAPPANTNVDSVVVAIGAASSATTCTLTCPANVVATANTTVGSQLGAFVKYGAASVDGDCGEITNSPISNSFFAVGTHTVTSSATGDSCTFTVKVLNTPAPTISCPVDKTAFAASGADDATVVVGAPTFTASGGGTVTSLRSDSTQAVLGEDGEVVTPAVPKALTDPYPIGVTSIIWTVTDADGRTASCTQKIIVSDNACGSDTTPPTITAPDDVTVGTGAANPGCTVTLDDELGQPEVNDNCAVNVTITGAPAGNNFAPGTYTLTYTATDSGNNSASDTQVVTVIDDTAPIIAAPADATYTCPSEVPAANVNQARGPVIGPDGQFVRDANGELVFSGPPFENCGTVNVTVSESNNGGAGSAANPRVITRTFTATDSAVPTHNSASAVQTITVADGTAPTISAPSAITVGTGPGAVSCDATISNATLGSATASDNCGGVTVTRSPAGNTFPLGTTTVTWTATDAAGNTATATQAVTVVDNTPPVITPPANVVVYLPLNSTATSRAVTYPNPATATDNCAGSITIGYSPASGSVFPVGTSTVTITATDSHSNSSTATFTVTVLYNFTGFFSPVDNLPVLNQVKAGQNIPLKFSLSGNKGLGILAAGFPASQQVSCSTNVPINDMEETDNPGNSTLTYSPDTYHYNWKTEKSWAGTCRVLTVKLNDGSTHTANFKFK